MMLRVQAPHFVAGVIVGVRAAPIVKYMAGWRVDQIESYCRSKGWAVQEIPEPSGVTIYTDGASRKDGRGGWGFSVWDEEVEIAFNCGGQFHTTNSEMELLAALQALRWACEFGTPPVTIVSDSQYVIKGVTEYMDMWLQNGWRTSGNQPVKHRDLWEELGHLDCDVQPAWEWVKGHIGDVGNERADELAGMGVPEKPDERAAIDTGAMPTRRRKASA